MYALEETCIYVCCRGILPIGRFPPFVRTFGFRLLVLIVVFTSFGIGIYNTWGDFSAMGGVFWRTILITTLIGIGLSFVYAPMTWKGYGKGYG